MTPDWLVTTIWFAAGVFATGAFWFFLASKNATGIALSACGASLGVLLATLLSYRNDRIRKGAPASISVRLLSLIWSYPLGEGNQASWAVKESAVLKGNLGSARDEPGLGVAIVTTELALTVFGEAANSRIDRCISWGVENAEKEPPYRVFGGLRDKSSWATVEKPDIRHTLAFAVILARSRRYYTYLESYVRLAVELQRDDGGWPEDSVVTVSPVFTAFYATELLHLAAADEQFSQASRRAASEGRDRGVEWRMKDCDADGLWSTGVLSSFGWDKILASAWVLHRLAQTADIEVAGWKGCLDRALLSIVRKASTTETWDNSSESQRQRVEARIAASVERGSRIKGLSLATSEASDLFLAAWKTKAVRWVTQLPPEELDVATAAFLLEGLTTTGQLQGLAELIVRSDARTP